MSSKPIINPYLQKPKRQCLGPVAVAGRSINNVVTPVQPPKVRGLSLAIAEGICNPKEDCSSTVKEITFQPIEQLGGRLEGYSTLCFTVKVDQSLEYYPPAFVHLHVPSSWLILKDNGASSRPETSTTATTTRRINEDVGNVMTEVAFRRAVKFVYCSRCGEGNWCGHIKSILMTMLVDPNAPKDLQLKRDDLEKSMPGVRSRLLYVLHHADTQNIKESLLSSLDTEEGLRTLNSILPETEYPNQTRKTCCRCKKSFDPTYDKANCYMGHPTHRIHRTYKDSHRSNHTCSRCGKEWEEGPYGEGCDDGGGGCYNGCHETDPSVVEKEDWLSEDF